MLRKRKVELDAVLCSLSDVFSFMCCDFFFFHWCVFTVSVKGTWVFICCSLVSSFEACNIQANPTFIFQIFANLKQSILTPAYC